MDSTMYFYYGVAQQWLLANGATKKEAENVSENKPVKIKYFDDLPAGAW